MELVITIAIGVFLMEAYAWLPKISKWLVERAVCRVCAEDQERRREEWNADLDALPNSLAKLVHAVSNCGAAHRINTDIFEAKRDEMDGLLKDLTNRYWRDVGQLQTCRADRHPKNHVENALQPALAELTTKVGTNGNLNEEQANLVQDVVRTVEGFCHTYILATNRASELLDASLDNLSARFDSAGSLLQAASKKFYQAEELLRKGDVSSGTLTTLMKSMSADLDTVKKIMDSDDWDDAAMREHKSIMAVIQRTMDDLRHTPGLKPH